MPKTMQFLVRSVVRVHDGDTLTLILDRGFYDYSERTVRLSGIDAPELRQPTLAQGRKVRDAVAAWVRTHGELNLISFLVDEKYGRVLGDLVPVVAPLGGGLADDLILNKLAKPYAGGTRATWLPQDLKVVDDFIL